MDVPFLTLYLHISRQASTEMSVLFDVLNIAKEKRYMVLDPVSQDPPENKSTMHMVSKRKVSIRFVTFLKSC